jgi:hypothetical protein
MVILICEKPLLYLRTFIFIKLVVVLEPKKVLVLASIEEVANFAFGIGEKTGILFSLVRSSGVIPSPAWKEKVFAGDAWRLG